MTTVAVDIGTSRGWIPAEAEVIEIVSTYFRRDDRKVILNPISESFETTFSKFERLIRDYETSENISVGFSQVIQNEQLKGKD
jgi:hypothetical protein